MELFILLWSIRFVIRLALFVLIAFFSVAEVLNSEYIVTAQSVIENSSNLTNPNNPTLKLDESYNQTSNQSSISNEPNTNLPSPMWIIYCGYIDR